MASSITGSYDEPFVLKNVAETLRQSGEFNLQAEVLYTAFRYLKENPDVSIKDALEVGLGDWDV